jgi:hypothetical protein
MRSIFCILLSIGSISGPLFAQLLHPYEPTPFRRDQLKGRPFLYDSTSFLHRLSYQPMPYLGRLRPVPDKVLQGTAGSISRDKFYVKLEATAHIPLEGPLYSGYRFRRDEDFDGRFDWNLIGLGLELGQWRLSVWGDVVAEKDAIDTHWDVEWRDERQNMFRFVWVMPDMIFNRKNEDAVYEPRPYTVFLRGERWVTKRMALKGFIQINNRTELRDTPAGYLRANQQTSGGGSVEFKITDDVEIEFYLEGLSGDRSRQGLEEPGLRDFEFDRDYRGTTAELRWKTSGGFLQWMGIRQVTYEEEWVGLNTDAFDSLEDRRETTVYWGREYPLTERLSFVPAVFLAYQEIDQLGVRTGGGEEGWSTAGFYGKAAPALRWELDSRNGAHLTLLVSTYLHRAAFGGGNVQIVFPF